MFSTISVDVEVSKMTRSAVTLVEHTLIALSLLSELGKVDGVLVTHFCDVETVER